jgi:pyruvate dehydrogenase E2 component (dihydrolipoamide acetyltransferase)
MAPGDDVRDFMLPDLGEGLEDAVLVEWLVGVGDTVIVDQPLCTVETAKATVDIPSPYGGQVVERRAEPGDTVDVGEVLVRIALGGDPAAAEPTAGQPGAEGGRQAVLVGYGADVGPSRSRRRGRGPSAPVVGSTTDEPPPMSEVGAHALAKPPVRKLARDLGVDLQAIAPGSGTGGTITRDDVERAHNLASPPPGRDARPSDAREAVSAGQVIPVTGIRARIAERMTVSRTQIPDAACSVEADCSRLLEVRAALRDAAARRAGADVLTPFALILRLVVAALGETPILNATYDADVPAIRVHDAIHLGVGVDTDRGLLVPVARNAQALGTLDLAVEVRRLGDGARAGTLLPAELVGSTFTVSNFGALGLDQGMPVINHPEAAILGVGTIKSRAVVVDGEVVARPTVHLSCTFDHRVTDGSGAGSFLTRLRDLVETPERLLLDV